MKTIKIKDTEGKVLFEHTQDNNTLKKTIRLAVQKNADLSGADLRYANLRYVNLRDVNLRDADLRYADLSGADLRNIDLRGADLEGAILKGAIRVPIYCKWSFGISEDKIHIGCEKRTIEEWDIFFASDKVIQTKRDTKEFKQIEAVYNACKAYMQTLNN